MSHTSTITYDILYPKSDIKSSHIKGEHMKCGNEEDVSPKLFNTTK